MRARRRQQGLNSRLATTGGLLFQRCYVSSAPISYVSMGDSGAQVDAFADEGLQGHATTGEVWLMPRSWLSMWEHQKELEQQQREMAAQMMMANPATCLHPTCRRYGNIHGSFSRCLRCQQRYKCDPKREGWVFLGSHRRNLLCACLLPHLLTSSRSPTFRPRARLHPGLG